MRLGLWRMGTLALVAAACACGGGGGSENMSWPAVTATVDGAPATLIDGDNGNRNYKVRGLRVRNGAQVRLEVSEPGEWSFLTSGASAGDVVTTETTWEATIEYGSSTPGMGFLDVDFCTPPCSMTGPILEIVISTNG